MNNYINELLDFALEKEMIKAYDVDYSANLLLDLLNIKEFTRQPGQVAHNDTCTQVMDKLVDYAVETGIIEDTGTMRDLFDTRIMNCIMPRPSEVIERFQTLYKESPKKATDYYYKLSIASNYIRKSRTDKNILFKKKAKYGAIDISINLSKPEKDPKEIAKAKLVKSSSYPSCLLCKENVGFAGDLNRNARQTHRIVPLQIQGDNYYMQYSPYVYYNEHCIIFNEQHKPMVINEETFRHLIGFLDVFPHYMIGSNADLPIVGGSILTHDHYQGGCYTFPIENARVLKTMKLASYPSMRIDIMEWPLSTIRLTSNSSQDIIELTTKIFEKWKNYSNESIDILSHTGDTRHNTVTPIARMKDGAYQMDVVLRNNRTNDQYPDGIFHPHQEVHHIKKENIGLIEVMGLAILPARLKDELALIQECLLNNKEIESYPELEKHIPWFNQMKEQHDINEDNVKDIVETEVAMKFEQVLENAGVFKLDVIGVQAFIDFVLHLEGK